MHDESSNQDIQDSVTARSRRLHGRAVLSASAAILSFEGIAFDARTRTVERAGIGVRLSPQEAVLLHAFLLRPNRPMAASELEKCVYGWEANASRSAIPELIRRLRKRLGKDIVRTLPGYGWMLAGQRGKAGEPLAFGR